MSADARGGPRRSRPEAGDSNDDLYNTNTQNVSGSQVNKASGRKVDLGTRSAGKNIHDSRDKHATQTVTINLCSPSSHSLSNKSRGKRQYRDSAGSENELSQEERQDDRNLGPPGKYNGAADAPSRCSDDCKKRQRLDKKLIRDQTLRAGDLESQLRETEMQLLEKMAELSKMNEQLNDIDRKLCEAMNQLCERNLKIREQAERIESYVGINRAAQDLQQAKDKLYELDRKDNEGNRLRQQLEYKNESLQRECQGLKVKIYSAEREKVQQEVSSLSIKMSRIAEKKRKVNFDLAHSKEQIQDTKARAKKDRDRERERERLNSEEETCQRDLLDAQKTLTGIDKTLTTLETQLQQANYGPSYEHPVSHGERSDSGYGSSTFSSVSTASPARSASSVFSNNDNPYDTRSLGSFGRYGYTISSRADRAPFEYERPTVRSSYSSPTPMSTHSYPPPYVPMPPPLVEILGKVSSGERKQNSHSGHR